VAVFTENVPRSPDSTGSRRKMAANKPRPGTSPPLEAHILVVDDDPAIRDSLSLMLEQENIATETFENAESFLATYQPGRCGCAIVDIRMPGMDGMQLQEVLAKRDSLLPIIFLTGHGDIPMSVQAMKAGASYECSVCGLEVSVERVCGCADTCDIMCCGEPMEMI